MGLHAWKGAIDDTCHLRHTAHMLRITDITYSVAGRPLFEGASAVIPQGHKVGLVGRNGTGKTTLFGLIRGALALEGGAPVPRAFALIAKAFAMCTLDPTHAEDAVAIVRGKYDNPDDINT